MLDRMKNIKKLCLMSINEFELNEIIGIIHSEMNKDRDGVKYERLKFINSNDSKFLLNSLIASLNGCRIPIIPTLLGPFRIWIYLRIFRSRRV